MLACISIVAIAQDSISLQPSADRDPVVGVWQANGEESRPKLDKVQRSYIRTISRIGADIIFSSAGGASKAKIRDFRLRCDGAFYPLPTGPVLACRWLNSNSVEGETRYPNGKKRYWVREVTSDGRVMTVTSFKDKARSKISSVMILDRVE